METLVVPNATVVMSYLAVTLGLVRVMELGVVVMVCVEEVCRLYCLMKYAHACAK